MEQDIFGANYNEYLNKHRASEVHKGYFSIDKKGKFVDSKVKRGEDFSDDVSAYDLIMKNKEQLLSFKEPTRFIFSHSALREGWDNPNVFQICTLKHSQSIISKRQEIGRGLRICVNSNGDRMDSSVLSSEFFDMNKLTVIASESYDSFAKELQQEIVESLSDRPIKLTNSVLKDRVLKNEKGEKLVIDEKISMDTIISLRIKGYLDEEYNITDHLVEDIELDKFEVIGGLKDFKESFTQLLLGIYSTANFRAAENEKANNIDVNELKPNENFAKKEFKDLWNKIKVQTVYEVDFDSDELIKKSIKAIDNKLEVKKVLVTVSEGSQRDKIDEESLRRGESMEKEDRKVFKAASLLGRLKYDLIADIAKGTNLTRKTVVKILQGIRQDTFYNFRLNPESFIKAVVAIINSEKAATLINNITYSKINKTYNDDIFTINSFKGSLSKNIIEVKKHVYDYLKIDSNIERKFADNLEKGEVLVYAKLPRGFNIPTPVGSYNPDWAIVFDTDKFKYVYFIAETKGSMQSLQLKAIEEQKIGYAKKHFEALGNSDIKYDVISTYDDLIDKVMM